MHLIGVIIIDFCGIIAASMPEKDPEGSLLPHCWAWVEHYYRLSGTIFGWYGPNENAGFQSKHCRAILILFLYRITPDQGKKNTSSHPLGNN